MNRYKSLAVGKLGMKIEIEAQLVGIFWEPKPILYIFMDEVGNVIEWNTRKRFGQTLAIEDHVVLKGRIKEIKTNFSTTTILHYCKVRRIK